MCSNTGTYVDSPFHRYADGADLADLSLPHLAGMDAVVVGVLGNDEAPAALASLGLRNLPICGE